MEKTERDKTQEVFNTAKVAKDLRAVAADLAKQDGRKRVVIGKDGFKEMVDVFSKVRIVAESAVALTKKVQGSILEYIDMTDGCKTVHAYGEDFDMSGKLDTEVKWEKGEGKGKDAAIEQILTILGLTYQQIDDIQEVFSISVKKMSDMSNKPDYLVAILKDKGYSVGDKSSLTIEKPKIMSKRSSGVKAKCTSDNRKTDKLKVETSALNESIAG